MLRPCIALLCVLSGCALAQPKSLTPSPVTVVEQYHAALNRRDLLVLTAYVSPDVEWYSVVDGERIQEVAGREALVQTLRGYFAQHQQTNWTIEHATVVDQVVAVREHSQWHTADGSDQRTSLAVYQVHDGRIVRITYFFVR